jgi:ribonuclease PH
MGVIASVPLRSAIAAVSVGISHNNKLLDFCYDEDSNAQVDFNVVMTDKGEFVEIQGTAEGKPYTKEEIDSLLFLAEKGIRELFEYQKEALRMPRKR